MEKQEQQEQENEVLLCCGEMDGYLEQGYIQRSRGFNLYTACLWNGEFRRGLSFHRNAVVRYCMFCGKKL